MEIETQLLTIIDNLAGDLSNDSLKSVHEFVSVGEWGIALETLCEHIYEDDVKISKEVYEMIVEAATSMRLPDRSWRFVVALIDASS